MRDLAEILFTEQGEQRIGQFIWNALGHAGMWKAPEANALFFITDEKLEQCLRDFVATIKKEQSK